jgi:hypothetical protein
LPRGCFSNGSSCLFPFFFTILYFSFFKVQQIPIKTQK